MIQEKKVNPHNVFDSILTGDDSGVAPFLERLEPLYARMDSRYEAVARQYGFQCRGCKDNCCKSTFYHHTLMEYLFLKAGFQTLAPEVRTAAFHRARAVNAQSSAGRFCSLCVDERCLLYAYRPMICRLHGIAHELRRPDRTVSHGPGCVAFETVAREKPYIAFDRTDFYWDLSRLEREARAALGFKEKVKLTVSQMIMAFMKEV